MLKNHFLVMHALLFSYVLVILRQTLMALCFCQLLAILLLHCRKDIITVWFHMQNVAVCVNGVWFNQSLFVFTFITREQRL